jgi:hypothetical protein
MQIGTLRVWHLFVLVPFILAMVVGGSVALWRSANAPDAAGSSAAQPLAAADSPAGASSTAAANYVSAHGQEAWWVQSIVVGAQADIDAEVKSPTVANVVLLAQNAQGGHDKLDQYRWDFTSDDDGALGDAEAGLSVAANDLKNAEGALVAFAGGPNPATAAHAVAQFNAGIAEWNQAVQYIWQAAGVSASDPGWPTI